MRRNRHFLSFLRCLQPLLEVVKAAEAVPEVVEFLALDRNGQVGFILLGVDHEVLTFVLIVCQLLDLLLGRALVYYCDVGVH